MSNTAHTVTNLQANYINSYCMIRFAHNSDLRRA